MRIVGTSRDALNGTLCTVLSELDMDTFRHRVKTRDSRPRVLKLRPVNLSGPGDVKAEIRGRPRYARRARRKANPPTLAAAAREDPQAVATNRLIRECEKAACKIKFQSLMKRHCS